MLLKQYLHDETKYNIVKYALIEISNSPNDEAGPRQEAQCLADNLCGFQFLISIIVLRNGTIYCSKSM